MPKLPSHEFWRYSLKLYENPHVKEACLFLQNHYALNVNILLFCCWHAAAYRGQIYKEKMQGILNELAPWHQGITEGIRTLRVSLCGYLHYGALAILRKEILSHELAAEQVEQLLIADFAHEKIAKRSLQQRVQDCIANFNNYLSVQNTQLTAEGYQQLQTLLLAAFPAIETSEISQLSMNFITLLH